MHENGGMHCVWHSDQMLKPCRSMLSPFALMCWKQQLLFFFFNRRKTAVKAISEVHRHGNDLQICLLHFSTDCAGKMTLTVHLWQKSFKLTKKKKKRNKWNNNMERVGTFKVFCMNAIVKWKSLWRWCYTNKRIQKCGSIVPASEISLVTLLFHYIPLCHHSEWLVLIMQMSQRKEAWVIITVVDRLWGKKMLPLP